MASNRYFLIQQFQTVVWQADVLYPLSCRAPLGLPQFAFCGIIHLFAETPGFWFESGFSRYIQIF